MFTLLALAACTASSNIRPSELERLDGYQARQSPAAERPLETVEGQSIAFGAQSKLFLDLPEQRVGGSFDSIQVREGVFEGRTADGHQIQARVAQIRGASVEAPDRFTSMAIAGGVLAAVAGAFVFLVLSTSSQSQAVPGRALRIGRRAVLARLGRADDSWHAAASPTAPDVAALSPDARAAIAAGWTDAARGEHASVPAFSRLSLTLMAMGAPSHLVEAAHRAALDEIEHTRLAFGLAAAYAGEDVSPGTLEELMTAPAVTADSLADLAEESLIDGCLLEGIAAEAARVGAERATDPVVRASLETIARDEATHVELAWDVVSWCCEVGGVDLRRRLLTVIHRAALPVPPLDVPPEEEVAMGDHGWLPPRAWHDVCERTQLAAASRVALMIFSASCRPPN